ncbi:MAG: hypothetical protein ACJ70Q_08280 [Nitrososphaera sp.]
MTYPESLVTLISNGSETKINKSGTILEITSMLPEVNSIPFANSITAELHGISKDQDTQKRKVTQNILAADTDFQVVFFSYARW